MACGQERDSLGDRAADGIDPARLGFREVIQDIVMDERLVAGMTDADPHPLVAGADMGGDRPQAVVAGVAAADLHPHLAGREVEFVMDDDEGAKVELRIAQSFADAASGSFIYV